MARKTYTEEDRARVECSLALGGRALELALEV